MPRVPLQRDPNGNLIPETYLETSFRGEYVGANLVFAATAIAGSAEGDRVWQIKKLTYAGANLISITWPQNNGVASTDFIFSWTDKATYTYS